MKVAAQSIVNSDSRVVVGLGATGLSCARYLHGLGLPFSVVDTRKAPPGLAELQEEMPEVDVYTGQYPHELITSAAEIIVSPGVAMDAPVVTQALAAGVVVCGDIDLFVRAAKAPIVGITGSNAKSTVTELLGQMARDAGRNVRVGGNLGTPALDLLSREADLYVLELSSFQLERAGKLGLTVATVLNVSADHLDRHHSMPAYRQAKHRIFAGCQCAVLNPDDAFTVPLLSAATPQVSWCMQEPEVGGFGLRSQLIEGVPAEFLCFGTDNVIATSELGLVGRHNFSNALAALALGYSIDLPLASMAGTLRGFKGLPHRCEQIAIIGGVNYINDSKGTNVGATEAALQGLGGARNIVLIAGGQGKDADFSALRKVAQQHCRLLVLIGEDAVLMQRALADIVPTVVSDTLENAVVLAAQEATAGDIVLLSPACASFDMFSGYVQRGDFFRSAVMQLPGAAQ